MFETTSSTNRASLDIARLKDLLLRMSKFNAPIESKFVAIIEINITMMSCGVASISDVHELMDVAFVSVPQMIVFRHHVSYTRPHVEWNDHVDMSEIYRQSMCHISV